jgi:hypothetical protein
MAFDIDKEINKVEEMVLEMVKKVYPGSKMLCLVNKGIELIQGDEKKEITSEIPYLWFENDIIVRSNEFQHDLDDSLKKKTINIERENKTDNHTRIHKFDIFFERK